MQTNIDFYAVADYAQKFSEKLCEAVFAKKDFLTGDDLLTICPNEQVGFFALGTIFMKWQDEADNLQSPFFDYKADAVQDALQKVFNILSRHIRLNKEAALEILEDAVEDTLLATISPYDFFRKNFNPYPLIIIDAQIKAYLDYVRVHKPLYDEIYQFIDEKEPDNDIEPRQMRLAVQKVLDETKYDYEKNISVLLKSLDAILPLDLDTLFEDEEPETEMPEIDPEEAEREPDTEAELFDIEKEEQDEKPQEVTEEPAKEEEVKKEKEEEAKPAEPVSEIAKPAPAPAPSSQKSLKDSIPLHKKFAFINELFDGNSNEFNEAVSLIDGCSDYHKAIQLIKEKYFRRYNWDLENTEVKDFYDLLSKRF